MNGHDLAEHLGVTPEVLYGWTRLGYLHPCRLGTTKYAPQVYRPADVTHARKMVALTNAGLTPRAAHDIAAGDPVAVTALAAAFDGATLEPVLEQIGRDEAAADRAKWDAMDLAIAVRDVDPRDLWAELWAVARDEPRRLLAAVVALAAMVPVETPVSELLAWTESLQVDQEVA